MRREILIDAYNVIFADARLGPLVRRDAEAAREQFLALVVQRLPADGSRGIVVFDAARDPRPTTETGRTNTSYARGLQIVYARETADTWIREHIRNHSDASQVTVVTSDREILETARAHGAAILRVSEFLQLAARRHERARDRRDSEKPQHTSRKEIEEMEKLFEEPRSDEDS